MEQSLKEKICNELALWIESLQSRVVSSEEIFRNQNPEGDIERIASHTRNVFLVRSLKNFIRIATFLNQKIEQDPENSQMYLCQLRTLADILSRVIYVLSKDVIVSARIISCEDLLTVVKTTKQVYEEYYSEVVENNELLSSINNFPLKDEISSTRFKNLQKQEKMTLLFPSFEDRLDENFIRSKTFNISEKFKISLKEGLIRVHTGFSNHVHGNHFFNEPQGNEIFWLATYSLIMVSYSCEIIDNEILNVEKAADTRRLVDSSIKLKDEISTAWNIRFNKLRQKLA